MPKRNKTPAVSRTLSQKLAMYLLYTEVGVVFFLSLTVYGLDILSAAWAFGGGAVLAALMILAARYSYTGWGNILGWTLQLALLATGFLNELMFVVGIIFILLWLYTMVKAKQIEREVLQRERNTHE
ncbi:MAG: DUF4233 domain-containing protein [Microbacteriaceae bacterium]